MTDQTFVDDDDFEVEPECPPAHVTAVLVSHDGSRWLPLALEFLLAQDRPADRVVAVDTGSTDGSAALLTAQLGVDAVLAVPRDTGFGAAVAAGVAHADEADAGLTDDPPRWIWLLHDDAAPRPDALRRLLIEAGAAASIGIAGPKVVAWHDRHWLLEVGVTVTGGGRRETGLERHELDQGQHDAVRDVLAVGSAGMLIRRSLWDRLGGMDPDVPFFRDDLDLGWRANAAGSRVVVVPDAVVHHAEAAAHGRRPVDAVEGGRHQADRRAALQVAAAHVPGWALPLLVVRLLIGSLVRAVGLLLAKDPVAASAEMRALGGFLTGPGAIGRSRRRSADSRVLAERDLRALKASPALAARHAVDVAAGAVAGTGSRRTDQEVAPTGLLGSVARRPLVLTAVIGLALSLLAGWQLWRTGWLAGGALLPAPAGVSDLWRAFTAGWHPVADGSGAAAPVWIALMAVPSTLTFGSVGVALDALVLFAIPAAAVLAHGALRAVGAGRPARWWGSAAYALLPAATGAMAGGRIGTLVVLLAAPVLLRLALPLLRGESTWRRAVGLGAALAVPTAFAPIVWPLTAAGLLGAALARPRSRVRSARLGAAAVLPGLLLAPWSATLFVHPSRLLLEAGATAPGLQPPMPAWRVLLLDPGGPGSTPWPVGAVLLLAALAALARSQRAGAIGVAWLAAVGALSTAVLMSAVTVTPPTAGAVVRAWPGPALVLAGGALVVAAALGGAGLRGSLRRQAFGWQQPVIAGVALLALAGPAAAAVGWVVQGAGDPLQRVARDPRPAFIAAADDGGRTLLVRAGGDAAASGPVGWSLLRDAPMLGDVELATPVDAAATVALSDTVADLVAGQRRGGEAQHLAEHSIKYVQVADPTPIVVGRFDETPGLLRVSGADGAAVWRVEPAGTPARLVAADGANTWLSTPSAAGLDLTIEAGTDGRRLVLAEIPDGGWRASLDGVPLVADAADPRFQAFRVPADGGRLTVTHESARPWWLLLQGLVVMAAIVILLPGRPPDPDADDAADEADPALRAATGGPR